MRPPPTFTMYTVYILQSQKNQRYYVGCTSKPLNVRLEWHKLGLTQWTRQNNPFLLVYYEFYDRKSTAYRREKFFKTGNGRKALKKLISDSVSARKHGGPAKSCGGG